MSRFSALDLSTLPAPTGVGLLDHSAILEARLVELEERFSSTMSAAEVADVMALARNIGASPLRYLSEAGAARELYMENRINQAVRSVFLATASGADLDQLGASRGVLRKVLDDSDPDAVVLEANDAFRARIQLVMEAWSPHGSEGSYVYWALDADDRVADVAVYGPNSGLEPPIPPAEPRVVVLSSQGQGEAPQELLDKVFANCAADTRRPVGDLLSVMSADPLLYEIEAIIYVASPEAAAATEAVARASVEAFVTNRIRIGRRVFASSIVAALKVEGVMDVELTSPAVNLDVGPFQAPYCSDIRITVQSFTGGWRDV